LISLGFAGFYRTTGGTGVAASRLQRYMGSQIFVIF
jgi:hypothetical protein